MCVCMCAHGRARTVSYPQNCLGRLYSQSNQCLMCPTPPLHLTGPTVSQSVSLFFFFFDTDKGFFLQEGNKAQRIPCL